MLLIVLLERCLASIADLLVWNMTFEVDGRAAYTIISDTSYTRALAVLFLVRDRYLTNLTIHDRLNLILYEA